MKRGHFQRQNPIKGQALNREKVLEIRKKYATGTISMTALARTYKVHRNTISDVVNLKTWRFV